MEEEIGFGLDVGGNPLGMMEDDGGKEQTRSYERSKNISFVSAQWLAFFSFFRRFSVSKGGRTEVGRLARGAHRT